MKQDQPIHDYDKRLSRAKRNIKKLHNGETTLHFLDHLCAIGLSTARVTKYATHLPAILRIINPDLKTITKTDIEAIVATINSSNQKEWTKHDKKLTLRKLVQYAKTGSCTKDTSLPPEVSWISLTINEKDTRVTPENLITTEDFTAIIKATTNKRDKAMIYVLFEAALRPGELLTMHVGSIVFKEEYCLISANGKTGLKRIPLVVSAGPLLEWLEEHPRRDDPQASLWCTLARNNEGKRLSYVQFRDMIKKLAKKADIQKDVWPYLYRHTSLTAMAKVFTEAKLEQFAGWTYGSKMTGRYVHFSARDLEDAVLELHGLKATSKSDGIIKMINCPRCGNKNPSGTVRCTTCGMALDKQTALKLEESQAKKENEMQQRLDNLEAYIKAQIQQQQTTQPPTQPLQQFQQQQIQNSQQYAP